MKAICTINMLRHEMQNAILYGCRGEKPMGSFMRNKHGTLSYLWH